MSTTQPTVEEQLRALVFKYEDGEDHDEGAFDDDCVICRILADLRALLSLRPPVEVGGLVDDPVVRALEAYDTWIAENPDAVGEPTTRLLSACIAAGWDPDATTEGYLHWALRRKVALQAAEIERLRRGPDGKVGALVEELTTLLTPESPMHPIGCATWEQAALYNIERAAAELTRLSAENEELKTIGIAMTHGWERRYALAEAARSSLTTELEKTRLDLEINQNAADGFAARAQAAEAALAKARLGLEDICLVRNTGDDRGLVIAREAASATLAAIGEG